MIKIHYGIDRDDFFIMSKIDSEIDNRMDFPKRFIKCITTSDNTPYTDILLGHFNEMLKYSKKYIKDDNYNFEDSVKDYTSSPIFPIFVLRMYNEKDYEWFYCNEDLIMKKYGLTIELNFVKRLQQGS